jgi:hypothetical protein
MLRRRSQRDCKNLPAQQVTEARSPSTGSMYWAWLLLVVLGMASLAVVVAKDGQTHSGADPEAEDAVLAAQKFVRQDLGPSVVPGFSPRNWTKVDRVGEQFVVSGWVEAAPKSGFTAVTYDYTCTVFRNLDGAWYPSDLSLQAQ